MAERLRPVAREFLGKSNRPIALRRDNLKIQSQEPTVMGWDIKRIIPENNDVTVATVGVNLSNILIGRLSV